MKFRMTAAFLALSALASIASAGEIKPFSQTEFDRLTQADQPVVVDVSATWCPTCKAQKPILEKLMKQPAYKDVTVLTVDFDSEKSIVRAFKVSMQSTLVGFKGAQEVARSVGDTTEAGIESLIQKTTR
ncbi:thioredoxin family protein [Pseudomonas aeruginosa]|uniref:Redoxin family protein n=4 Tax=Pseudomonadota TaxID=1224 RepID=A0A844NIC3_PSEAI|nr:MULTISPECIES: thioredoxin family protein [Pseudomonadota]EKW7746860.1 thioredoxin family protein [Morganella morganii]HAH4226001.1 thioredoxin [Escherichia coli]ALV78862.1 Thioredoxin [Pseudomonas aeruginosa]ASJ84801.1 putative thioredoxin [Pseudomonas aeruginosa]AVK25942.1 thioredoxin family protein [Pseudomonas aeruginosa]